MPPKGRASIPFMAAMNTVMFLPVTVAKTILFYPLNTMMWLLVDIIGANKYKFLGTGWLCSFPVVKKSAGYVKEFRAVLIDYFSWPKSKSGGGGSKSCKNCKKPATWWCIQCKGKFCNQCGFLLHAPGTNSAGHSMEKILDEQHSACRFITPILPAIVTAIMVLYTLFCCTLVTEHYLTTQVTCPMVSSVRSNMAWLDANLYARYKEQIFGWCDSEDSFWRFFLDLWVRGIVTDTDNTVLVMQTLPQAVLFDMVLLILFCPIVSVFYAVLAALCRALEVYVGRTPETEELERQALKVADLWGQLFGTVSSAPPQTAVRITSQTDPIEHALYMYNRQVRNLGFYFNSTYDYLQYAVQQWLVGITVLRLVCIWFRVGPVLRVIWSSLFHGTVAQHRAWFVGVHDDFLTEKFLWRLAKSVYTVTIQFTKYLPDVAKICLSIWFVLSVITLMAFIYFCNWVVMKRRENGQADAAHTKAAAKEWSSHMAQYNPTSVHIAQVFVTVNSRQD